MLCGLLSITVAVMPIEPRSRYVLLPVSAVKGIIRYDGTWVPTKDEVRELEASVGQIATLPIEGWAQAKLHIEHPENYYRQYVPLRREGRRLIYVSALCDDPPPSYWRTRFVVVVDGATCYWQAFYDPATKRYSHLTINARA